MTKLRPCATFRADFPDDQVEEDGDIVRFGGHGVTEAIAAILKGAGYTVSSPLEYRGEMGWAFDVVRGEQFLVSPQSEVDYILTTPGASATSRHAEALTALNLGLTRDPRFTRVRWFLNKEIETDFPGADAPVSEDPSPFVAPRDGVSRGLIARWLRRLTTPKTRL
jgi:hypothetical protein